MTQAGTNTVRSRMKMGTAYRKRLFLFHSKAAEVEVMGVVAVVGMEVAAVARVE
jgi:predicted RNA-binding protein with PUA-like domain